MLLPHFLAALLVLAGPTVLKGAAQELAPPPGVADANIPAFQAKPIYHQGEHLRLTFPDKNTRLVIQSDLAENGQARTYAPGPLITYDESSRPSYRRQHPVRFRKETYRRVKRSQHNKQEQSILVCDLGPFSQVGLHQVYVTPTGRPATLYNLFAYTSLAGKPTTSSVIVSPPAAAGRDALLQQACARLAEAFRDAKQDALATKWDALLAQSLATRLRNGQYPYQPGSDYLDYRFALVFAPDNPVALLVLDSELMEQEAKPTQRAALRLFIKTTLSEAIEQLADPSFSNRKDNTGQPIALLSRAEITACQTALGVWSEAPGLPAGTVAGPTLITLSDAGFSTQALLAEGVDDDAASAFRLRSVKRGFQQMQVLFRLLSPVPSPTKPTGP